MTGALRWFQAYVPRSLVHQLMREGDLASLASDRRNVTVLFSDIAGYSTISESRARPRSRTCSTAISAY